MMVSIALILKVRDSHRLDLFPLIFRLCPFVDQEWFPPSLWSSEYEICKKENLATLTDDKHFLGKSDMETKLWHPIK